MAVVIEDFEVITEPPPASPPASASPAAPASADLDEHKLAAALERRQWCLQRLHAD